MNIKGVAKWARLSTAMVSCTINGCDKVSPETAEWVQRAHRCAELLPSDREPVRPGDFSSFIPAQRYKPAPATTLLHNRAPLGQKALAGTTMLKTGRLAVRISGQRSCNIGLIEQAAS